MKGSIKKDGDHFDVDLQHVTDRKLYASVTRHLAGAKFVYSGHLLLVEASGPLYNPGPTYKGRKKVVK